MEKSFYTTNFQGHQKEDQIECRTADCPSISVEFRKTADLHFLIYRSYDWLWNPEVLVIRAVSPYRRSTP